MSLTVGAHPYPKADLRAIVDADTQAVLHAEDNQIVDEHYLQEVKRAVGQANAAESECDDVRRNLKQLRSSLEGALHKKTSVSKMVSDYQRRLEQLEDELEAMDRKIEQSDQIRQHEQLQSERIIASRIQAAPLAKEQLNALRAAMERSECRVVGLRQRHMDAHNFLKGTNADLEYFRQSVKEAERRKQELDSARLQLAASEASNVYRDAQTSKERFTELQATLTRQSAEMSSIRVEKQAMIMHLLGGCKERTDELSTVRGKVASALMKRLGSDPQVANELEMLNDLIATNKQLRADSVNVLLNTAQEKEALEQYVGVLSERSADLMNRVRDAKRSTTNIASP